MRLPRFRPRPPRTETPVPLELALDALAAYRITRLLTVDTFPPVRHSRERFLDWTRRNHHSSLAELIRCAWCAGFWVAGGVAVARIVAPRQWSPVARVFAISAISGIIAYQLSDDVVHVVPELPEGADANDDQPALQVAHSLSPTSAT